MNYISYDAQTEAIISAGLKLLRENLWEDLTPEELFKRARKTSGKYGVPDGVEII